MRVFVALAPSPLFLDSLEDTLVSVRAAHPEFRWLPRENLHITLAFLGDIDSFGIELLNRVTAESAAPVKPIAASTGKLLMFPQRPPANALALGINEGRERVSSLASFFEQNLFRAAQEERYPFRRQEKRPFVPHITVARKGKSNIVILPEEKNAPFRAEGVFESITVFQSELCKGGAVYTPLFEYQFRHLTIF
jgi:2'-5' RNA ligase